MGFGTGALVVVAISSGSTALAMLASVLAIVVAIVSPLAGLIALAFAAPLARTLVIPPPGLYAAMAVGMVFGVLVRLPVDRPRLKLPSPEVILLGAFLVYAAAQLLAARIDGPAGLRTTELASLFARIAESVLAFAVTALVLRGKAPYAVLAALLVAATISALLGLGQLLGVVGSVSGLMEPVGESGRISGVFANPNYYGAYLATMAVLAVALLSVPASRRVRMVLLALTVLLVVTLLATQSRGGLATLLAGLIAIAFVHSWRAGVLTTVGLASGALLAYPAFSAWRFSDVNPGEAANLVTAGGRTDAWTSGLESFLSSPVFGIGLGRFQDTSGGIAAHNWYVQVLAELGLVGMLIWGLFIVAAAVALRHRVRPARIVGYSMLATFVVASMSMSPPTSFRLAGPMLISIAAAIAAVWNAKQYADGNEVSLRRHQRAHDQRVRW